MQRSTEELQHAIITRQSPVKLANGLGVSRAAVSQWSHGHARMTLDTAILASQTAEVTLSGQRALTIGCGIDWDHVERQAGANAHHVRELRGLVELCYEAARRLADRADLDRRQAELDIDAKR